MKAIPTELKIYWSDGVTIECRYFKSRRKAMKYAKNNGVGNYKMFDASPCDYNKCR